MRTLFTEPAWGSQNNDFYGVLLAGTETTGSFYSLRDSKEVLTIHNIYDDLTFTSGADLDEPQSADKGPTAMTIQLLMPTVPRAPKDGRPLQGNIKEDRLINRRAMQLFDGVVQVDIQSGRDTRE